MATVTRENIGLLNEKLVVKVEKDDYLPSFQKAIKDYSKRANIPGFRKGMVPVGMVKKMYGSSVFADEVIKSVEKGLSDYMLNEKLKIFAQPLPLPDSNASKLDMNQPAEYEFAFEVGLKPEFEVPNLASAPLKLYKIDVTDEMVSSEIEKSQDRMGKISDQEFVTTLENNIRATFIESDADGNERENGLSKEVSLQVKNFTSEFQNKLMGLKKDDSLTLLVSNAFEQTGKENISKQLQLSLEEENDPNQFYKMFINEITLFEQATLNEEFFMQVFPDEEIADQEAFREQVKRLIQQQWEASSRNQLHDQIYHELLHTPIEFPEDFLKRWMLTGTEKQKSSEEVEAEYPTFVNQLKWTLVTDKLMGENSIEVTPDDLRKFAKSQLFSYMGGSNINIDQPWVNDYVEGMMKDKKFLQDSMHRVEIDKIFAWAETQAKPVEVAISEEDFKRCCKNTSMNIKLTAIWLLAFRQSDGLTI